MKKKISIIIPMYNAEKYIANCLDSIIYSDLPKGEYEIIIVNDGSNDKSPQIAQDYASRYENCTYLTQENQGQSVARNYGISICKGEYVWFVDCDDLVIGDFSNNLINLQMFQKIDILAFESMVRDEEGNYKRKECVQSNVPHNQIISGRDAIVYGYNPSAAWALWIRRSLMIENDLYFKEGITHQDVELTYRLFTVANKVMFTSLTQYVYVLHDESTSQSINPKKKIKYLSDDIVVYQSFMNLAHQYETDKQLATTIRNRAQNVLFSMVMSLYRNRKQWSPLGINKPVVDRLKENGLYPLRGPFDSWKKTLFSKFLNIESLIV